MKNDKMQVALNEARLAAEAGEVPIGAAIFLGDKLLSSAHNETISRNMPDAHAEMLAIRKACEVLGDWRLSDCELYVTLEPCAMCSGTIMLAKIKRLYFGAYDTQSGVCGGKIDITHENLFGSNLEVYGGICEKECSELISNFFSDVRRK